MSKDKSPSIFLPQMEAIVFVILQIFFTTRAVLKIGEYLNNSVHFARKYARIFVRGHYLFREAKQFSRASTLTIRLRARVFYEQIVNEAQTS